jgi:hypothetical protein
MTFWLSIRPAERTDNVPDLMSNCLVRWQYRFHGWLIIVGLGLPTVIGALFGRPIEDLLGGSPAHRRDPPRPSWSTP